MGRAHVSQYLPGVEGLPARAVGGELGGAAHPHPREAGNGPPVQPPHTPTACRGGEGTPHAWGEKKILWWEINPQPPSVTCKACLARIFRIMFSKNFQNQKGSSKNSKRYDYEPVDEKSLSLAMPQKTKKKRIRGMKG